MVGRDAELDRLLELARHRPCLATIEGAAGVGKTLLLNEFLRRPELSDSSVIAGRCPRMLEPLPFVGFVDALRGLGDVIATELPLETGALRHLIPELAVKLPAAPPLRADFDITRHLAFRAVVALLRALSPTVLVLEDVQWVDAESAELLRYLIACMPEDLMLVLTARNRGAALPLAALTTGAQAHVNRAVLELGPLDIASVGAIAAAVLGASSAPKRLAELLHASSGGLPAAAEELTRFALAEQAVLPGGRVPSWLQLEAVDVPPAVRDAVIADLDALGASRQVVQAAAVLELPASARLLGRVAGQPPGRAAQALNDAVLAGMLLEVSENAFALRHTMAARAICSTIPGPQRRTMHLRAAQALVRCRPRPLERLARHHRGSGRRVLWLACAESAADRAMIEADPRSAVRLLWEALGAGHPELPLRIRLTAKLARAAMKCGGFGQSEAIDHLRAALEEVSLSPADRANLLQLAGELLGWTEEAAAGRDALAAVVPLTSSPSSRNVRVLTSLSSAPTMADAERAAWLSRAEAEAASVDDPHVSDEVAASRAHVLAHVGDRGAWAVADTLSGETAGSGEHALHLLRLAWVCVHLGHYDRAQGYVNAVDRGLNRLPERLALVCDAIQLALRWVRGDWEGLEHAALALASEAADVANASVPAEHVAGLLMLARGAYVDAETLLRSCIDRGARAGLRRSVAVASAGLTRILLRRRQAEDAWAAAIGALELITEHGVWAPAAELVPAAVSAGIRCGRLNEVEMLVRDFARALRGVDSPVGRASLAFGRGLFAEAVSDHSRAQRRLMLSTRLFAQLPQPYTAARVAVLTGQCLVATGDRSGGALALDGIARLGALGATADAAQARHTLRRLGIHAASGASRGRRGYGSVLSPREQQVAALAARALTCNEIAEILQISPRTVEGHVAAVVRKTSAAGKRGLIRSG